MLGEELHLDSLRSVQRSLSDVCLELDEGIGVMGAAFVIFDLRYHRRSHQMAEGTIPGMKTTCIIYAYPRNGAS